jgi:pyruvate formate lyase activating enzyme
MKEALLYTKREDGVVTCRLCAHRCTIHDGSQGICGVRINQGGILYTLVYDKIISAHVDPIEKKPLYHLLPGSLAFSIATVGCNFRCYQCQNYEISQMPREYPGNIPGSKTTPEKIVSTALRNHCDSIAYTYTEPTIFFELAYDTAKIAHAKGLKNIFVTNGYMTQEALDMIRPYLDGANVDLKGFDKVKYLDLYGGKLEPVKETIRRMKDMGIWVEVTTLIIPTHNDSEAELRQIAEFIQQIDPDIPWHVSAFSPQYRMIHLPPTPASTIFRAVKIGKEAGLHYVYSGNVRGGEFEDTWCYNCSKRLIHRLGFYVQENLIVTGKCPECGTTIRGMFKMCSLPLLG